MSTLFPDSDPLPSATKNTSQVIPLPTSKPRQKRTFSLKLSVSDFTKPGTIESALSIGRKFAAKHPVKDVDEGQVLGSLLDRLSRWAKDVAPEHDLAEFVVGAQAIGGNRELKQFMSNIRLAELRQVSDAWRTVKEEKKRKKDVKNMDVEDGESQQEGGDGHNKRKKRNKIVEEEEESTENNTDREEGQNKADGKKGNNDGNGAQADGKVEQVLLKDPGALARIERSKRLALERRKAAMNRNSAASRASPPVGQSVVSHLMDIDPNDVIDVQEDIDMDILDEIQHQDRIAVSNLPPVGKPSHEEETKDLDASDVKEKKNVTVEKNMDISKVAAPSSAVENDSAAEIDGKIDALVKSSAESNDQLGTKVNAETFAISEVVHKEETGINYCGASEKQSSLPHAPQSSNISNVPNVDEDVAPAQKSSVPEKASQENRIPRDQDVDMDILNEFEAGADEEY